MDCWIHGYVGEEERIPQVWDALPSFIPHFFGGAVFWLREIQRAVRGNFLSASARDEDNCAPPLAGQKKDLGGYECGRINGDLEDAGERKARSTDSG
jgi:hypothetical protein